MVSSKGKPTDPKLREEVKDDVLQMTNKDGGGKGQMAAWKAGKIAQEYEKKGGDYENEPGSKNEPAKGAPKPKTDEKKTSETKDSGDSKAKDEKPKANSGKKAAGNKSESKPRAPKKAKKPPTEGTRKSSRLSGKRSAPADTEEKPSKKSKTDKK